MSKRETEMLIEKITLGVELAIKRVIEQAKKENGELVVSRNGIITRVKASELK